MKNLALAQKVLGESRADPLLDSDFDPGPDPDLYILVMQYLALAQKVLGESRGDPLLQSLDGTSAERFQHFCSNEQK